MSKINNIKQITNNKPVRKDAVMNLDSAIKEAVDTIKKRVEKEIPDVGYFRNFAEDFKNTDKNVYAKAVSIAVQRDVKNDGMAYLSLNLLHPTMFLNASTELAYGNRKQLLEAINDKDFLKKVEAGIKNLSEDLKNVEQ